MRIRFGVTNMYHMILLHNGMRAVGSVIIIMQHQRGISL